MRPNVVEILRGARQAIEDSIIPDLRSEWAIKTANLLGALMEYLIVVHESLRGFLEKDNANLKRLVTELESELSRRHDPAAESALQRIRDALSTGGTVTREHLCAETLMAENLRLRAAVEALILAWPDVTVGEAAGEMEERILQALSEQIAGEFRLVEPLMARQTGRR